MRRKNATLRGTIGRASEVLPSDLRDLLLEAEEAVEYRGRES